MNSLLHHLFGELSGHSNLRSRFYICLLNSKFMNTHELNKWPRLSPPQKLNFDRSSSPSSYRRRCPYRNYYQKLNSLCKFHSWVLKVAKFWRFFGPLDSRRLKQNWGETRILISSSSFYLPAHDFLPLKPNPSTLTQLDQPQIFPLVNG